MHSLMHNFSLGYSTQLIHEADHSPGRQWSLFSHRVSVRPSIPKLRNQATITAAAETVGWPNGSWMTPVLFIFLQHNNATNAVVSGLPSDMWLESQVRLRFMFKKQEVPQEVPQYFVLGTSTVLFGTSTAWKVLESTYWFYCIMLSWTH